jgi:hypothetical protein
VGEAVNLGIDTTLGAPGVMQRGPRKRRVLRKWKKLKSRLVEFRKKDKKLRRMCGRKEYARIHRAGLMAGVLYGAELNQYSEKDLVQLNASYYRSCRADVPWVPNYVKEVVVGPAKVPSFLVQVAPILAFTREVWLRTDVKHGGNEDCLTANEIVQVWQYVCEDKERCSTMKLPPAEDAIGRLIEGLGYFGAVLQSPCSIVTRQGCFDLEIVSGARLKKALGQCRSEAVGEVWLAKLQEQKEKWFSGLIVDMSTCLAI